MHINSRQRSYPLCSAVAAFCFASLLRPAAVAADHGLQLGLDTAFQAVRDDTLAPVASSGPRVALVPRYFGELGPGVLQGDLRFGFGYVVDRAGARGVTTTWGMHASYLPIVYDHTWQLAIGPALGWDNDDFFLIEWDDAHTYWIGTLWLGPGARAFRWLSGRWRIDLGAELGLLGWQSRTPQGRRRKQETSNNALDTLIAPPTTRLKLGSLLDWQILRTNVDFYYARTRTDVPSGWGVGAELGLVHTTEPVRAFAFNASLRFSYTWSLQ